MRELCGAVVIKKQGFQLTGRYNSGRLYGTF